MCRPRWSVTERKDRTVNECSSLHGVVGLYKVKEEGRRHPGNFDRPTLYEKIIIFRSEDLSFTITSRLFLGFDS